MHYLFYHVTLFRYYSQQFIVTIFIKSYVKIIIIACELEFLHCFLRRVHRYIPSKK